MLSSLESGSSSKPKAMDCFDLWYNLGALRHGVWSTFPASGGEELKVEAEELESRLRIILASRKQEILRCLDSGMAKALKEAEGGYKELRRFFQKREISSSFTSVELNAGLFWRRDQLGFASLLSQSLGLQTSPKIAKRLERLDENVGRILSEVLRIYRAKDDDPTPYPERFPKSFWWRQLS